MFFSFFFFLTGLGRRGKLDLEVGEGSDRETVEPGVTGHDGGRELGTDIRDLEEPGSGGGRGRQSGIGYSVQSETSIPLRPGFLWPNSRQRSVCRLGGRKIGRAGWGGRRVCGKMVVGRGWGQPGGSVEFATTAQAEDETLDQPTSVWMDWR